MLGWTNTIRSGRPAFAASSLPTTSRRRILSSLLRNVVLSFLAPTQPCCIMGGRSGHGPSPGGRSRRGHRTVVGDQHLNLLARPGVRGPGLFVLTYGHTLYRGSLL